MYTFIHMHFSNTTVTALQLEFLNLWDSCPAVLLPHCCPLISSQSPSVTMA